MYSCTTTECTKTRIGCLLYEGHEQQHENTVHMIFLGKHAKCLLYEGTPPTYNCMKSHMEYAKKTQNTYSMNSVQGMNNWTETPGA